MRKFLLAVFINGLAFTLYGGENSVHYAQLYLGANALYEAGQYDSAKLQYAQIINSGHESFTLYYNMGNASYKTGDIPTAIFYYEKALKLNPNDGDALFNLQLAESQIIDKIDVMDIPFANKMWEKFSGSLSLQVWSYLFLIMCFLNAIFFAIFLFSTWSFWRRTGFFISLFFTFTSLLTFFAAQSAYMRLIKDSHAIVFSPTLEVKAEPRQSSANLFVIHEGTKVRLLENTGDWKRIVLPDGNEGWVPEGDIMSY